MQQQNVEPTQKENEVHAPDTLLIDSNVVETPPTINRRPANFQLDF
jgi:hypothetical protein